MDAIQMPETDDRQRFNRLMDAMVNKFPLDVADKQPLADADDNASPTSPVRPTCG
jgi:hypothetical protein